MQYATSQTLRYELKQRQADVVPLDGFCYLAAEDYSGHVVTELGIPVAANSEGVFSNYPLNDNDIKKAAWRFGDFFYSPKKAKSSFWSRVVLEEPMLITFSSISEAANALKAIQRNWACYSYKNFRRASLIQDKLPYVNNKEKSFPYKIPDSPMGLWCLVDENTIIASAKTSSPLPCGVFLQKEDHENPPSRAYLKIQEALTLFDYYFPNVGLPKEGDTCLDAGACPGGWTWVLRNLGCKIHAIDRAPLCDDLMNDSHVTFTKHDAFTLKPEDYGKTDWVFSDVICYPSRLLEWISLWLKSNLCKRFICTIKMQGEPEWDIINKFANIPNSKVMHLSANKHELTWLHVED